MNNEYPQQNPQGPAGNENPYPTIPYELPTQTPPGPYGSTNQNPGDPFAQPMQNPYNEQAQYNPAPPPGPYGSYTNTPPKKRVWPFFMIGCLIFALLGMGGCAGCVFLAAVLSEDNSYTTVQPDYSYDEEPFDPRFFDDIFSEDFGGYSDYDLDDIKVLSEGLASTIEDGICSTGMYMVGAGNDINAGLYFLEGSQDIEGEFYLFKKSTENEGYTMVAHVVYFGNYYADLNKDEIIVFVGPKDAKMYSATEEAIDVSSPIESGLYRVGIDIPAGTYKVTFQKSNTAEPTLTEGAFVMKDLFWSNDSITQQFDLMPGSSHTVTVVDGEYLELYKATMVAADDNTDSDKSTPSGQA